MTSILKKIKVNSKKEKGITLIALIITIVILIILSTIAVGFVFGDNGLIPMTQFAQIETRASSVEEQKDLWNSENRLSKYVGKEQKSLEELLNELRDDKLITEEEKEKIENDGHVIIGNKDISFCEGLNKIDYTLTSSLDEIIFKKIIKEGDIIIEKPEFTSYVIEGITKSKEEEPITTGSIDGKSGNLEIIGDINETTFKYNLTDFMNGDETFYCKVNIDGEEYFKEIKIIQGDVITYEEDFVGIKYSNGEAIWVDDYNEQYTNGKAKMTDTTTAAAAVGFTYTGRGCEVISRVNENTGYINGKLNGENFFFRVIQHINNGEDLFKQNITRDRFDNLEYGEHEIQIGIATLVEGAKWGPIFYLDAVKIYK